FGSRRGGADRVLRREPTPTAAPAASTEACGWEKKAPAPWRETATAHHLGSAAASVAAAQEAWATASEALSLRLVPVLDSGRARSPPRSSGKREASAALCESPPPKAAGRGARTRGCPPGARLL
ncbi:unnamed protein product, partial [Prorocentrum cordatum]